MNIIYDSWDASYKSLFGAIKRGEMCLFSIKLPLETKLDSQPVMVIFKPGYKERFLVMTESKKEKDHVVYSTSYFAKYIGVHFYYFAITIDGTRSYIKKISSHIGAIANEGGLFQLTVFDEEFTTPEFLKGGVMYQIFPDRFYKSNIQHSNVPSDRVIHEDWNATPSHSPFNGKWNYDYFGGDLEGIKQKLDYLDDLGVTCIYLNPIFEAHENHRYNTANYRKVDPLLGTNDDFKELCKESKKRGINVILDGVFSHTGADSVYFNKFNRYDTIGAYNSNESEFYDWYSFQHHPDIYDCWWGIDTLPNVKENNPKYTDYICGENGVLEYWMELGADGYRLDVADELPDEFLDNLNKCVKRKSKEKIVIGEVWEDASNKESYGVKRRYLLGCQLDSVMNYPFKDAILDYVSGGNVHEFRDRIMTIVENYPKPAVDVLMNFISTHDIERAITRLGGDSCHGKSKEWMSEHKMSPQQYDKGKKLLKVAMVLQFFLPGVPSIFYGDEAGLEGYKDPFNRRCYPWGKEDTELIEFTKKLSWLRKSTKLFKDGTLKFLVLNDDVLGFARIRSSKKKAVVIFVNRTPTVQYIQPISNIISKYTKFNILVGSEVNGQLVMNPYGFALIKIEL